MGATQPHEQIRNGTAVFGADGSRIGVIAAVYPGYLVVEKGFFFPTDYFVPRSAVASANRDHVYLNTGKDNALEPDWEVEPVDLDAGSFARAAMPALREAERDRILSSTHILDEEEILTAGDRQPLRDVVLETPLRHETITARSPAQTAEEDLICKEIPDAAEDRVIETSHLAEAENGSSRSV